MILRFIADMHHSAENNSPLFVRDIAPTCDYFDDTTIFSSRNFARIVSLGSSTANPPFFLNRKQQQRKEEDYL
jgi:hypothetical protein